MSWVFVSHSSRDSRQAVAVKAWLIEQESSAPTPGRRRGADSKRGAAKRKQKGVQAPGGMVDMQALGGPFGAAAQWKPNSPEEVITQVAKYMKSLPELIISGQLGLDPLPPVERRELLSGYSLFDALETIPRLQSRWDVAFTTTQRPDIVEAFFPADDDFESCRRARERVMQHRDLLVSPRATAQLQREIIESASTDESAAKIERNTLPGLPARRSSAAARVIDVSGAAPTWCGWSGGLDWVEAHGESERVGLANDAAHGALRVEPGEVVAAEIGVLGVVGERVPHRDQNRVFHGDKGFLLPRATGETAVSSAEVGGVFGAGRSQGSGAQRAGQPPVAVTGLAGATFAGRS